jgi:Zn-dependent protease
MDILTIVTVIGVVLLSMTLHEAMHAFMGYWLGDDTARLQGRLTLNPIKHIDPILTIALPVMLSLIPGAPIFGGAKPVPFNPNNVRYGEWGAALVAVAGPLTNFILAFVIFGIFALTGASTGTWYGHLLTTATLVNLGFFVFNMIPIPPLDGSRVFYALAPEFIRRGMEAIERFGVLFILVIVMLANGIIGSFMLGAIQFFVGLFARIFGVF